MRSQVQVELQRAESEHQRACVELAKSAKKCRKLDDSYTAAKRAVNNALLEQQTAIRGAAGKDPGQRARDQRDELLNLVQNKADNLIHEINAKFGPLLDRQREADRNAQIQHQHTRSELDVARAAMAEFKAQGPKLLPDLAELLPDLAELVKV